MAVSQAKNILAHLVQHKTITPLEALNQYGCFRLSAVIFNLKKRWPRDRDANYKKK